MSISCKRCCSVILAVVVLLMAVPSVYAAEWDRPTYPNSTVYASSYPDDFSGLLLAYPAFIGSTTYVSEGNEITVTRTDGWDTTTTTDGQAVLMYTISGTFTVNSLAGHNGYVNNWQIELDLTSAFSGITVTLIDATADGFVNSGRTLSNNALYVTFQRIGQKIDTAVRAGGVIRIPYEITVGVYIPTSDNSISTGSKLKDYITGVTAVSMSAVVDDDVFLQEGPVTGSQQQELTEQQMDHADQLQTENQDWLNGQMGGAVDPEQNGLSSDVSAGAAELETFDQNTFQSIALYKSDLAFDLGAWSDYASALSYVRSIFMAVWNNSPTQIVTVALMLGLAMMLLGRGVLAVMRMQQPSGRHGGDRRA